MSTASTTSLPLHVRVGIRDLFEKPESSLNKALTSFNTTIGYTFTLSADWLQIWETVQDLYDVPESKATLVPGICGWLEAFFREFERYLEQEDGEGGFQERWLTKVESGKSLRIVVGLVEEAGGRVAGKESAKGVKPRSYFDQRGIWRVELPVRSEKGYKELGNAILDVVMGSLSDPSAVAQQAIIPLKAPAILTMEDPEWDVLDPTPAAASKPVVTARGPTRASLTSTGPPLPTSSIADFSYPSTSNLPPMPLPNFKSLPNPTSLFPQLATQTPPILILTAGGSYIDIQCSHPPTLELISSYFNHHARLNPNLTTRPPYLKVELLSSMWGAGSAKECVRIYREDERHVGSTANWVRLDVAYLVAFIEGVCEYNLMRGCTGENGAWIFRRLRRFA